MTKIIADKKSGQKVSKIKQKNLEVNWKIYILDHKWETKSTYHLRQLSYFSFYIKLDSIWSHLVFKYESVFFHRLVLGWMDLASSQAIASHEAIRAKLPILTLVSYRILVVSQLKAFTIISSLPNPVYWNSYHWWLIGWNPFNRKRNVSKASPRWMKYKSIKKSCHTITARK